MKNAEKKVDILREDRICNGGRDCCEVFRKELFTKFPFPVFPGEKFIGEGAAFYFIECSSRVSTIIGFYIFAITEMMA